MNSCRLHRFRRAAVRGLLFALALPLCAGAVGEEPAEAAAEEQSQEVAPEPSPQPQPSPGVWRPPVGVTRGQIFDKGSFMVAYRFGYDRYEGNIVGNNRVTPLAVAAEGWVVAPLDQEVEEHRIELTWAPHDRIALVASLPYLRKRMDNLVVAGPDAGRRYRTHSDGFGDFELAALFDFIQYRGRAVRQDLQFNFALSFPTGSVTMTDTVLTENGLEEAFLPYRMQLGSGTVDLIPEIVYRASRGPVAWGFKSWAELRMGENTEDYRLGAVYGITTWASYDVGRWASGSARFSYQKWGNVFEAVDQGPPSATVSPARDPKRQGGQRVEIGPGLSFRLPLPGVQLLSVEALWAVYQDLDGPQLAKDWGINAGWQWTF